MGEPNPQQRKVLLDACNGKNICITGPAGTGKSFLIQHIKEALDRRNELYRILAPTGVAAVNVGGQTIHHFLGLRPGIRDLSDYVKRCAKRSRVPWYSLGTVIIDEVSMMHPDLFNLFDVICRFHKRRDVPFGGVRLILLGDFFQLSPIKGPNDIIKDADYIFQTQLWKEMDIQTHVLTQIMRQKEHDFAMALNDLRVGDFTKRLRTLIKKCSENARIPGKQYVRIFARNVDKNNCNDQELAKLSTEQRVFFARDKGERSCLRECQAASTITLKVGCPVMLLWNLPDSALFNGSIGVVHSFVDGLPRVLFNNGKLIVIKQQTWTIHEKNRNGTKTLAERTQIPLALAYSIVAHKCQSLTIDYLEVDCTGIFGYHHLYVMLSRGATAEGLIIRNFTMRSISVDKKVFAFYQADQEATIQKSIG